MAQAIWALAGRGHEWAAIVQADPADIGVLRQPSGFSQVVRMPRSGTELPRVHTSLHPHNRDLCCLSISLDGRVPKPHQQGSGTVQSRLMSRRECSYLWGCGLSLFRTAGIDVCGVWSLGAVFPGHSPPSQIFLQTRAYTL